MTTVSAELMSVEKPRIAVLGMHLESNAFAPVTTENDFGYLEGQAIYSRF